MKTNATKTAHGWGDERVTKSHKMNSVIAAHKRKERQESKINALLKLIVGVVLTNIRIVDKQDGTK